MQYGRATSLNINSRSLIIFRFCESGTTLFTQFMFVGALEVEASRRSSHEFHQFIAVAVSWRQADLGLRAHVWQHSKRLTYGDPSTCSFTNSCEQDEDDIVSARSYVVAV
jgi:hypothetical protein